MKKTKDLVIIKSNIIRMNLLLNLRNIALK